MAPRKNDTEIQQDQRDDDCDSLAHDPYNSSFDVGISILLVVRHKRNAGPTNFCVYDHSFRTRSFDDRFEIHSPELNWHRSDVSRETFF